MLQGFNLVPPVLLDSLCDTHLQPSDLPSGFLPIYGTPLFSIVDECTSRDSRHLLSHLKRFSKLSRNKTPVERRHAVRRLPESLRF